MLFNLKKKKIGSCARGQGIVLIQLYPTRPGYFSNTFSDWTELDSDGDKIFTSDSALV